MVMDGWMDGSSYFPILFSFLGQRRQCARARQKVQYKKSSSHRQRRQGKRRMRNSILEWKKRWRMMTVMHWHTHTAAAAAAAAEGRFQSSRSFSLLLLLLLSIAKGTCEYWIDMMQLGSRARFSVPPLSSFSRHTHHSSCALTLSSTLCRQTWRKWGQYIVEEGEHTPSVLYPPPPHSSLV